MHVHRIVGCMHVENIEVFAPGKLIDDNIPKPIVDFEAVNIWRRTIARHKIRGWCLSSRYVRCAGFQQRGSFLFAGEEAGYKVLTSSFLKECGRKEDSRIFHEILLSGFTIEV